MSLVVLLFVAAVHVLLLMIDMIALLLFIRALRTHKRIAVLAEFDQAGKPLVDRTLRYTKILWCRFLPHRRVSQNGHLLVAWVVLLAIRLCVTLLIQVVV